MDWVRRVIPGWRPLPEEPALLAAAARIQGNALFDAASYKQRASITCDDASAALHYTLIGDVVGIAPSDAFDPDYYAERYPDIATAGAHRLLHYLDGGHAEGRHPKSPIPIRIDETKLAAARDNVIVVVHETSRTGAPLLGWNIASMLAARHNVFAILLGDGPLTSAFIDTSVGVLGPFAQYYSHPADLEYAIRRSLDRYDFKYAIANGCESRLCSNRA